jgi:enoyl-CoA hydratase/carnithine racemase
MSETAAATRTLVHYEVREGVAWLTLDDPPANTYTHEMMLQLDAAILKARFDESVHVLVLTGAGEKMFCAGANINMLKASDPTFKYYFCLHANETLSRLEQTPKLVLAALNGNTVGGGLEIAMAADLRIARRAPGGGSKFGLPEVALGVLPGTGGTQRLLRIVGKSRAIDLMVTGRLFGLEEAEKLGIVDAVFDGDSRQAFLDQVQAYARQFCPPAKAARAVGRIKRSVQSGAEVPFESALTLERELQQQLFQGEDAKEGLAAYIEKRQPVFKAR